MPRAIARGPCDPLTAAIHESAHVIARLAHGVPFQYVEICEDGTGAVVIGDYREPDRFAAATRCLAGPMAEAWFADRPLPELVADTGGADFEMAMGALEGSGIPVTEAIREAERLIADNWTKILAVAKALAERGRLTLDEAAEIAGLRRAERRGGIRIGF